MAGLMVVCIAAGSFADEADVLLMVKQHSRSNLTQEALQAHAKRLEAGDEDVIADMPRTSSGERALLHAWM